MRGVVFRCIACLPFPRRRGAHQAVVKDIAKKELSGKRLFVVDAFCGANKDTRMAVRFIVEVAWQAHFIKREQK